MEPIKIGVTERGDGGLDLRWTEKMNLVDGAIIITKNLNESARQALLQYKDKVILHCGCTGLSGTLYEPNTPDCSTQLANLNKLLSEGFDPNHVVLRIDPIIPNEDGHNALKHVLELYGELQEIGALVGMVKRIRISIVDMYPHVRNRFTKAGIKLPYNNNFSPSPSDLYKIVGELLAHTYTYETCAEPYLKGAKFKHVGCVSKKDLDILGLETDEVGVNPQNRNGCLCLTCKTELLSHKHPCDHKCLYCYWKD